MRECDITEAVSMAIEDTILKEWRHEGAILGMSSQHINFEVDGLEYVLKLREVTDGEHWSDTE